MREFTKKEILRQDFVDNEVFDLINKLLSPTASIDWDIEIIGNVRDAIRREVTDRQIMSEQELYPYRAI